jgi:serine-type D-Ala-D-Ala carboxypeptidase/endopeptidase (penicillin-binding protein 4)
MDRWMDIRTVSTRVLGLAFFVCSSPAALTAQQPAQQPAPATLPLQAQAEEIVERVGGSWGVMAWSIDRQQPLFAINTEEPLIPASNNKVITAVWALDRLGSDYRFPTELLITGPIGEDGVLRGDVVLRGSGDPAFGSPTFTEHPMEPLRTMARQLRARGVRAIEGGVVGDPFLFDTVLFGPEWPQDTGNGAAAYAPRVSGLPFQRNLLWVQVIPQQGGAPAIRLDPPVTEIPVVSQVRSGGGRAWATRQPNGDTIYVRGAVSGRGPFRYGVGVANPALLAAGALRAALQEEGIAVQQPTRVDRTPENATIVHRHLSMPLGYMIELLNRDSDNFYAEQIWRATVAHALGVGSATGGGAAAAHFFAQKVGVPYGQVYQADGSGLSRQNRASAFSLIRALDYGHRAPWSELFHLSMAVAGGEQGTLRRQFVGTPAANNLHAKTGFIRSVRTLSGYVRAANGELIAFAFLYNGSNTPGARAVHENLGVLLAEYGLPSEPQQAEQQGGQSADRQSPARAGETRRER